MYQAELLLTCSEPPSEDSMSMTVSSHITSRRNSNSSTSGALHLRYILSHWYTKVPIKTKKDFTIWSNCTVQLMTYCICTHLKLYCRCNQTRKVSCFWKGSLASFSWKFCSSACRDTGHWGTPSCGESIKYLMCVFKFFFFLFFLTFFHTQNTNCQCIRLLLHICTAKFPFCIL